MRRIGFIISPGYQAMSFAVTAQTKLLSEGTFGIITDITPRLHGVPEPISAAICAFPSIAAAIETVVITIQAGIPVARLEFLDEVQAAACNRFSGLSLKEAPTLYFEFHGSQASAAEQAENVRTRSASTDSLPAPDRHSTLTMPRCSRPHKPRTACR